MIQGIDIVTVLADATGSPAQAADALSDACAAAYLEQFPDAHLTTFAYLGAEFLFDANPKYDRTVLVIAQPAPPDTARDASYQRGYPLAEEFGERRVDRGHFIPFTSGGSFGPNLYVQDRALNSGWSRDGRRYRALERRAATTTRGLMFAHALYLDALPVPGFVQLGLVSASGHEAETFRNRFDDAALVGADRLLVELGGATDAQIGALGEETVAVLLEEADAIVVTTADAGMERDQGRQDLDLVAVIDDELVALEVKTRFTSRTAGRLTRTGDLPRPRLRRGGVQARQASQKYVAARIADIIDLDDGFDGMEVRIAVVDFVAMLVQFYAVDDAGRYLARLGPPQACREAADVALQRILDHRGHL